MNLRSAKSMVRLILGDESESIWDDDQVISALNLSNKRIMARIVAQNPEQYVISYEDALGFIMGDTDVAPLSVPANSERNILMDLLLTGWAAESATASKFSFNPIRIIRLCYSMDSNMNDLIEIPLVPFSALDERKEQQVLEYEVFSRIHDAARMYKASYAQGTMMLYIRPVPTRTMYLKIYWAEAGVPEIGSSTDLDTRLLHSFPHEESEPHINMANTPKAEAVVFDACWTLSFKDQSMRDACAVERDRILKSQSIPSSPSEAY